MQEQQERQQQQIVIQKVSAAEWVGAESESAYFHIFGEHRSRDLESIDFALRVVADGKPIGYVQCIEMDRRSLYIQFGGAIPEVRGSKLNVEIGKVIIEWSMQNYNRVSFRVENSNLAMIIFSTKLGFKVIGTRTHNNAVYLEFSLEKSEYLEMKNQPSRAA